MDFAQPDRSGLLRPACSEGTCPANASRVFVEWRGSAGGSGSTRNRAVGGGAAARGRRDSGRKGDTSQRLHSSRQNARQSQSAVEAVQSSGGLAGWRVFLQIKPPYTER